LLIQAAVGSAGGRGGCRTKRSGVLAYAASRTTRRASWICWAQSFAATGTEDPTLAARAHAERRWIATVLDGAPRTAIVDWHPVGIGAPVA